MEFLRDDPELKHPHAVERCWLVPSTLRGEPGETWFVLDTTTGRVYRTLDHETARALALVLSQPLADPAVPKRWYTPVPKRTR